MSDRAGPALRFPGELDAAAFLARYWQRKPLLMPAALRDFASPLDAGDLAGLACEQDVESRLVIDLGNQRWEVRHGPFTESDFAELPDSGWTLLVQDVDKHAEGLEALVDTVGFLPSWRFEDLMFSYAAPGGSVGPHVDAYDVFLLQATGRRQWQVGSPVDRPALIAGLSLRVMREFSPVDEWVLEPGDALYLPPGVPHHGVAIDPCITVSIGFRAPSVAEMLVARATHLAGSLDEVRRYADPAMAAQEAEDGLISDAALARTGELLAPFAATTPDEIATWFGELVTEPKPWLAPTAPEPALDSPAFLERLRCGEALQRHPASRLARTPGLLFVDGESLPLGEHGAALAPALCRHRRLEHALLRPFLDNAACVELLHRLYAEGRLYFDDDE